MKSLICIFCLFCIFARATESVTYEAFGAKGDGKQNDASAIIKAHQYANSHRLPVRAADGRTYYIGKMENPAIIQTDTDWGNAHFILDDRNVSEGRRRPIFIVAPSQNSYRIHGAASLKRGDTSIGAVPGCLALVLVKNKNVRQFIRKGGNRNAGTHQQEVLLVDQTGKIHPDTPLLWDYNTITEMKVFPLEKKKLLLRGGNFTTIANRVAGEGYYGRGIVIRRSHVTVSGIQHKVTGEGEQGSPYSSFVSVSETAYVTIEDSVFCGHRYYRIMGRGGSLVSAGTYDLGANHSCFITWRRCRQFDSIHDKSHWGIFGSNFCRRLCMEECVFSRFDAHQGVADAVLRGCEFGHQGISVTGFGTLLVENCQVTGSQLIHLRPDYGSFWRGKIIVQHTKFCPGKWGCLIWGSNDGTHDFGYPCMMPEEIILKNIRIENKKSKAPFFLFGGFKQSREGAQSPYQPCRNCTISKVKASNRKPVQIAKDTAFFRNCRFVRK